MELLQELDARGANRLYIDGDWRESSDSNEFPVLDPATEEVLTHVSSASPEDAIAAVATAHEAGPEFAALTRRERSERRPIVYCRQPDLRPELGGCSIHRTFGKSDGTGASGSGHGTRRHSRAGHKRASRRANVRPGRGVNRLRLRCPCRGRAARRSRLLLRTDCFVECEPFGTDSRHRDLRAHRPGRDLDTDDEALALANDTI
ncbi:MAG: aldehyde dehydrogenase family protein [Acidimicrobiia bacterium]|nr:aldehyde dehydrogenase family protein [Acidimicrobiia bacterium]